MNLQANQQYHLRKYGSSRKPASLSVKRTKDKGRGVFACSDIIKGQYLCSYEGVLLDEDPGDVDDTYIYEIMCSGKKFWIDATADNGSIGRLINDNYKHPNCRPKVLQNRAVPYLIFEAIRDIKKGEEICYNYGPGKYPWRKMANKKRVSQYSIVSSGLTPLQKLEVEKLAEEHGWRFQSEFNSDVSHIVFNTDPLGSRVCNRTMKFLKGIANKKWLLDYKWVEESRAAKLLLLEDDFEILGDTVTGTDCCAPQTSRLSRKDLLSSHSFYCADMSDKLSHADIQELICACGGTVSTNVSETSTAITCKYDFDDDITAEDQRQYDDWFKQHGVKTVSRDWLIDSISLYDIQPLEDYILNTGELKSVDADVNTEIEVHFDADGDVHVNADGEGGDAHTHPDSDVDNGDVHVHSDGDAHIHTDPDVDAEAGGHICADDDACILAKAVGFIYTNSDGHIHADSDVGNGAFHVQTDFDAHIHADSDVNIGDFHVQTDDDVHIHADVDDGDNHVQTDGDAPIHADSDVNNGDFHVQTDGDVHIHADVDDGDNHVQTDGDAPIHADSDVNNGDFHVQTDGDAHIHADVDDGDIHVQTDGDAPIHADSDVNNGDFHVQTDGDAHIHADVDDSDIHVQTDGDAPIHADSDVNNGDFHVQTDGDVHIHADVDDGDIHVQTDGDAHIHADSDVDDVQTDGYSDSDVDNGDNQVQKDCDAPIHADSDVNIGDFHVQTDDDVHIHADVDDGDIHVQTDGDAPIHADSDVNNGDFHVQTDGDVHIHADVDDSDIHVQTDGDAHIHADSDVDDVQTDGYSDSDVDNGDNQVQKDCDAPIHADSDVNNGDFHVQTDDDVHIHADVDDGDIHVQTDGDAPIHADSDVNNGDFHVQTDGDVHIHADVDDSDIHVQTDGDAHIHADSDVDDVQNDGYSDSDVDNGDIHVQKDGDAPIRVDDGDFHFQTDGDAHIHADPDVDDVQTDGDADSDVDDGDIHVQTDGDAPIYADSDVNNGDFHVHSDGDAHIHADSDVNNGDFHVDSDGDAHIHADSDFDAEADGHICADGDSHIHADSNVDGGDVHVADGDAHVYGDSDVENLEDLEEKAGKTKVLDTETGLFVYVDDKEDDVETLQNIIDPEAVLSRKKSSTYKMRELIDPQSGELVWVTDEFEDEDIHLQSDTDVFEDEPIVNISVQDAVNISVQVVASDYVGLRDYSKKHECYFCETTVQKMGRHLEDCHSDEADIAKLPELHKNLSRKERSDVLKRRSFIFNKIRYLGDFYHNVKVLKDGKGVIFVAKRSSKSKWSKSHESFKCYLPCNFCYQFVLENYLWRHAQKCMYRNVQPSFENEEQEKHAEKQFLSVSKLLLQGAGGRLATDQTFNEHYYEYVIKRLANDEVSMTVKSDSLLLLFGKTQFEKLGKQRSAEVRSKLRIVGRLKIQLRILSGKLSANIAEFLSPEMFDTCVEGIKKLCIVAQESSLSGTEVLVKPDLALKAGQLLKKLAHVKKGQGLRLKDHDMKEKADDFIALYISEWNDKISAIARQNISERKYNKKEILPLTSDLVKLSNVLEKDIKTKSLQLRKFPEQKNWLALASVTLARITIFNKRRAEEPSKMLLSTYHQMKRHEHNEELLKTLNSLERELLKKMQMVEVLGKQDRKVPVLLTPDMQDALKLLVDSREQVNIPSENPYVFASVSSKKGNPSLGHLRGCKCIKKVAMTCNLNQPELITSTKLRKYMATVAQVLNMTEIDLQELARHMGHELSVHRHFYRLQEDVTELSKISKLLLLVEAGEAHRFSGKNLDDIELGDLFEEVEDARDVPTTDEILSQGVERKRSKETVTVSDNGSAVEDLPPNPGQKAQGQRKRKHNNYYKESCDEYEPDESSSDNDDDEDDDYPALKKRKIHRTTWTCEEKIAMEKCLLPITRRTSKPPKKADILKCAEKFPSRSWRQIKFRVWAMYQSKRDKLQYKLDK